MNPVDAFMQWFVLSTLAGVVSGGMIGIGVGWLVYKWRYAALRKRALRAREAQIERPEDG